MAALIFARLAFRVKKIANGRTAQSDCLAENLLERFVELTGFLFRQFGGDSLGMNSRSPEAFVGVDIADTAKSALIK